VTDNRLIDAYVRLVFGEAEFEDERLELLRTLMTHAEREQAAEAIALEILRREPIPERAN
jgi:mannitol/fructose-specific phosphotransferase system IIA component